MRIVLETSGKRDSVIRVRVKLFDNLFDATNYCREHTDNPMDEKYWNYCEVIEEGRNYEISRYKNY